MTTTLREVLCVAPGEDAVASVVVAEQGPQACPEDGILVAVRARPINPADLLLLNGRHVFQPVLPAHVGIEGAGQIVAVGPRSRHVVGTRVAIPWGGTWRDRMPLPDDGVLVLPHDVDFEQAAMLCVNPFTVMGLLEGVEAGSTLVVNAATSAVSRLLLAVARRRGLRVVGVVRREEAIPAVKAAGAEQVVVDAPDLADRIRAVAPGPVVLALDAVAGAASGRLFDALSDGGTLIVYGLLASDKVELPATGLVFRNVHVRGFSRLRAYAAMSPERREAITAELIDLLREGLLEMPVDGRYAMTDVKAALEHHLQPGRSGKILLVS
jgi:NADPH:quinone reductase-like Zn-dependent oxidoreductase